MPHHTSGQQSNARYFASLRNNLVNQQAKALRAAVRVVFKEAMERTVQDSGNAAYNWDVAFEGEPKPPFERLFGIPPVGPKGEGRKFSGAAQQVVIRERLADFDYQLSLKDFKGRHRVDVYNNIIPPRYEAAAEVDLVGAILNTPGIEQSLIDPAVRRALAGKEDKLTP